MKENAMSRRSLLRTGGLALAGAALLRAATPLARGAAVVGSEKGGATANEEKIRTYYAGWERKDWSTVDNALADGFTFTSPNGDNHISKAAFKARCWSQADFIEHFDLESVVARDDQAFVKYLCHTKNGKSFRNTEYFRFKDGKIEAIECYFGDALGFPSAASTGCK